MNYQEWLESKAQTFRDNPTICEGKVLRYFNKIKLNHQFQVPIMCCAGKGYIADFVIPGKIIVEVDGKTHVGDEAKKADWRRTKDLERLGYRVIRITNKESLCKETMARALANRLRSKQAFGIALDTISASLAGIIRKQKNKKSKTQGKKKGNEKKQYWAKYDPDMKRKLYAANGW